MWWKKRAGQEGRVSAASRDKTNIQRDSEGVESASEHTPLLDGGGCGVLFPW